MIRAAAAPVWSARIESSYPPWTNGSAVRVLRAPLLLAIAFGLAASGWVTGHAWPGSVEARESASTVATAQASALAAALELPPAGPLPVPGAEIAAAEAIGALRWRSAGFTGYGVRVAVVDFGFAGYESFQGNGLPANVQVRSFRADGDVAANHTHGTLAARIVAGIAPDAELYLVNFSTVAELSTLVDFLIAERVQVVSFSVGYAHSGPGNGTGAVNEIVSRATSNGMFWSVAAGNWAQQHWGGAFTDRNGNSVHEFAPGVEEIGRAYSAGDLIIVSMRWDDPWGASCNDYDLELLGPDGSLVRASRGVQSCKGDPVESIQVLATRDGRYRARIVRAGAVPRRIDLLMLGTPDRSDAVDFPVMAGSVAEPADSRGVFTVGAVASSLPTQPARFSSRGPTIDGRAKPDLIAPTGPGADAPIGGTSAAAPHAAGAAALLLDALPQASSQEVASQLRARAQRLPPPATDAEVGAGVLDLGALANIGPLLPPDAARARLTDITPPGAPIAVYRYRGPSAYPARFLRLLLPGRQPVATYRLDFARGRFDTFVTRAPSVANSFELVTDGDLLFVTFRGP